MAIIIDRTDEVNQAAESRKRYLERLRESLRASIKNTLQGKKDSALDLGPLKADLNSVAEPKFRFDFGHFLDVETVIFNEAFKRGDVIKIKLDKSGGQGSGQGERGQEDEGTAPPEIQLTEQEFSDIAFEGLELPYFVEKASTEVESVKFKNAGYTKHGNPSQLSVIASYKRSFGRRVAAKGALDDEIAKIREEHPEDEDKLIFELEERKKHILYFDEEDLQYHTKTPVIQTISTAVVFLALDVSGSMGEMHHLLAKKFFYLFYLFLKQKYKKVEVVFITHTETASEVSEREFFFHTRTGGTSLACSYELILKLIKERYSPEKYNLYVSHASDSDYMYEDDLEESYISLKNLIPMIQYGTYLHVDPHFKGVENNRSLEKFAKTMARAYTSKTDKYPIGVLIDESSPYKVFYDLFKKKV